MLEEVCHWGNWGLLCPGGGGGEYWDTRPHLSLYLQAGWRRASFPSLFSTRMPCPSKGLKTRRPSDYRPKPVKSWVNINLFLPCMFGLSQVWLQWQRPTSLIQKRRSLPPDAVRPVCYRYACLVLLRLETETGLVFFFFQLFLHLPISVRKCIQVRGQLSGVDSPLLSHEF